MADTDGSKRPDPYVQKFPNDIIRSGDWNELQVQTREEIRDHRHTSAEGYTPIPREGIEPNAIDGTRIDPSSKVTVTDLTVSGTFKAGTRTLLPEVDSLITRTARLEEGKLDKAGGNITGSLHVSGNVGIGTLNPKARLEVNGGSLMVSSAEGNADLFLNSKSRPTIYPNGSNVPENLPLQVRSAGTSALLLNADNPGNVTMVLGGGNVGIGTAEPRKRLHIQEGNITASLVGGGDRPGLAITGSYPELVMFSAVNNVNHGPALRLSAFNDDTRTSLKGWSIGTAGRNARFLDIGFSTDINHHGGIRNFSGKTIVTLMENGNTGIGTLEPGARLSVTAPGEAQLEGSIKSEALLVTAGRLGGTKTNALTLASIGFRSGNNSSLGVRAYRTADGTDWTSTSIGLCMDVDNTPGAGASLWLKADGNVGIGTAEPRKRLHIQEGNITASLDGGADRPGLAITGTYPELVMFSAVNNGNHGPAIRLSAFNDDTRTSLKGWSIGTAGRNARFLDIGFSTEMNHHGGIRNFSGKTVLTLTEDGNVGVGTTEPRKRLHIQEGNITASLFGGADRPGLAITGTYPELVMFSAVNNGSHGPAIRLSAFDDDTRTSFKGWSIGTAGRNARFLDIGFSTDMNHHGGIRNYNGKTVLTLTEDGNVGIGAPSPGYKLDVAGNARVQQDLEVTGKISTGVFERHPHPAWGGGVETWDVIAHANGFAHGSWLSRAFDLAERFYLHEEGLEAGDVVVADPEVPERLIRSTAPYQDTLMGVISEKPGFILGVDWEDPQRGVPLGLAGRVPVKVTLEGGPIRIGDMLTSAETPGHAMKATRAGRVLGLALQSFDGSQGPTGRIIVFINTHWRGER
jgi:hypothetical protein